VGNPGTPPTAFAAVDGTTYYVGYATAVYKSGRFLVSAATPAVTSIALAGGEIFIGTGVGTVLRSTDDALNFTAVGAAVSVGNPIIVTTDPGYATNRVIYAASPAVAILQRFTVGTSPAWGAVGAPAPLGAINDMVFGARGELYAAGLAGMDGVFRVLGPAAPAPINATIGTGFDSPALVWPLLRSISQVEDYAEGANNALVMVVDNFGAVPGNPINFRLVNFIDAMTAAPVITTPTANQSFAAGSAVAFTVAAYVANWPAGHTYDWQVAYDTTFAPASTIDIDPAVGFQPTFNTPSVTARLAANVFPAGTNLYLRVRVATPLVSNWSAPVLFTTRVTEFGTALAVAAPAPGSTTTVTSPAFQWTPVEQATHYEFTLSDRADFSTVVDSEIGIRTNVYNTPVKLAPGTYYWRVRAMAGTLAGSWLVSTFNIVAPAPVVTPPPVTTPAPQPTPIVTVVNPTPVITVPQATVIVPTPTFTQLPAEPVGTPGWAWVVIIIGAILLVAVIVLIVRTRKV
ncbi:MAG TPA: hypothetical protein VLH15_01615, partial [Dehalococcoidales bacterium]|nr:hypothetical protein [Dehalococcoidales bacterium]